MREAKLQEKLAPGEVRDVGVVVYDLDEVDVIEDAHYTVYDTEGNVLQAEADATITGTAPTISLSGIVTIGAAWPQKFHVDFTYWLNAETIKSRLIVYKVV